MTGHELPQDIFDAAKTIQDLQAKTYKTREDTDNLNRAKLRIAFWSCRSENIVASRENLAYVLGSDAKEIMGSYDRYLEREEDQKAREGKPDGGKKGGGAFWGNA